MEISQKLQDAINEQINFELYSAFIYLSMATWFEEQNLPGFAHWMEVQYQEEFVHAIRFYRHLTERGGRVLLKAIEAPKTDWPSAYEVFADAYNHEKEVTSRIYKIGEIAEEEKDRGIKGMLQWFYNEQVEEENNTSTIRDQLKMIGDSTQGLFMMDRELGARPAAPAPPLESFAP